MKKEDLFEGFGALDDDLLARSEQGGSAILKKEHARKTRYKILQLGGIAACLTAIAGAGLYLMNGMKTPAILDTQKNPPKEYADVSSLLADSRGAGLVNTQSLILGHVAIGRYQALYEKTNSAESGILAGSIGDEVDTMAGWYRLSGHKDMQYLIFFDGNEYSLWKFHAFQTGSRQGSTAQNQQGSTAENPQSSQKDSSAQDQQDTLPESYPYRDVLETIYAVRSAADITEVIVFPPTIDNSSKGKEIQAEIGTVTVTDTESIQALYDILSGLACYGGNHWEMVGLGEDTPAAMESYTRAGRYLTLITSGGMEIDTLKYAGINGLFYEYGGIAYNCLTDGEKSVVEAILSIQPAADRDDDAGQNGSTDGAAGRGDTADGTWNTAREYPAELIDLQNRVSAAMAAGELPFVSVSAIYENPDRLHVTVNTKDEELLARLKALDTTGSLLEIEYSENRISIQVEKKAGVTQE